MIYPEIYQELGIRPSKVTSISIYHILIHNDNSNIKGIILHGPTGCGKTQLANAVACEILRKIRGKPLTYFKISAPELVSNMSGESESNIRNLFLTAKVKKKKKYFNLMKKKKKKICAQECEPALIFIDEIDSISPKRDSASKEMERRIVAQLLASFDGKKKKNFLPPKKKKFLRTF
jgi:ribosome biogenesis ATPase